MKKKIKLKNTEVQYEIKRSIRAKRMRLAVYCSGNFVVTLPTKIDESCVEKIIQEKSSWILDKILYFRKIKKRIFSRNSEREYLKCKSAALKLARKRVEHFNQIYKLKVNGINIKRQKTRWGSCSKKGNLNFNYKIVLVPKKIADYIIVHEMCHLKEFNHSRKFWNLVEKGIPAYKNVIKEINDL